MKFPNGLHIGNGTRQFVQFSDRLYSDTIASALFVSGLSLFGSDNMKGFMDGITVSSAFPFLDNDLFFPMPKLDLSVWEDVEEKDKKTFKKLKYIDKALLLYFIKNGSFPSVPSDNIKNCVAKSTVWSDEAKRGFIKTETVTRLNMSLINGELKPMPFQFQRQRFGYVDKSDKNKYNVVNTTVKTEVGLFFLAKVDASLHKKFESALKLLSDNGLGADRTTGLGTFTFEMDDFKDFDYATAADKSLLLSLWKPSEKEMELLKSPDSYYTLIERGGWTTSRGEIYTPKMKKSVYMVEDGSVIGGSCKGEVVDLAPAGHQHPIYRSGKAIAIKLN